MLFRAISYLKFLLKSTNEHGVHSPFVFKYVTEGLYRKKRLHKNKSIDVLLKSIAYFNFTNILLVDNPQAHGIVQMQFPEIQSDSAIFDLLFIDHLSEIDFKKLLSEGELHNNSMVLVNAINATKQEQETWHRLTELPEITVSIDMFYCGALFIRREQVKEHFTIRI